MHRREKRMLRSTYFLSTLGLAVATIFGKGKPSFLNLVRKSEMIQSASRTMTDVWADQQTVGNAAVGIFVKLYGGNKKSSLRQLR